MLFQENKKQSSCIQLYWYQSLFQESVYKQAHGFQAVQQAWESSSSLTRNSVAPKFTPFTEKQSVANRIGMRFPTLSPASGNFSQVRAESEGATLSPLRNHFYKCSYFPSCVCVCMEHQVNTNVFLNMNDIRQIADNHSIIQTRAPCFTNKVGLAQRATWKSAGKIIIGLCFGCYHG